MTGECVWCGAMTVNSFYCAACQRRHEEVLAWGRRIFWTAVFACAAVGLGIMLVGISLAFRTG